MLISSRTLDLTQLSIFMPRINHLTLTVSQRFPKAELFDQTSKRADRNKSSGVRSGR
jgi:hypothetical protein